MRPRFFGLLFVICHLCLHGGNMFAEEGHVRKPLPSPEEISKLPADGGEEFNRLIFEKSPYLLQHARNPVDWWPWSEEAFARAKEEDKPIFLSVGYTTCHWCHVMEHESFEDEEVAEIINERFIPVKVDREERPDIDHIYMESYLWDHDLTKQTLKKVGKIAKTMNIETSLSLSDPFCVDRHRDELKEFIEEYVDLVFCNFDEAKMFAQSETMADVSSFFQSFGKKIAMTASAEGAYYFHGETVAHQPAQKIEQVIDTTGAGDNFAAGFLDQYLSDKTIDEALAQGNSRAGEVIQQLGPRIKRH